MARSHHLYQKLDQLEREYTQKMVLELERVATGQSSQYFSRRIPGLFDGKAWRDRDTAKIEKMEQTIDSLRKKLGEPSDTGPAAIVKEFVRFRLTLANPYDGSQKCLAKSTIERLKEVEHSASRNGP